MTTIQVNTEKTFQKKKYDQIDLLKAIAIYFVIIYHFNQISIDFISDGSIYSYLNYYFNSILSVCVPVFFFINGLLLLNKDNIDLKKHILKILKIVAITIIWGAITLICLNLIRNEPLSIAQYIIGSYYLIQEWNNHLWFLGALIVIYIFYPLLFNAYKTNIKIFKFTLICVLLFTFGNVICGNLFTIISFLTNKFSNSNLMVNYWGIYNPFSGIYGYSIGYFMLGGIIFKYKEQFNNKNYRYVSIGGIIFSMLLLSIYGIIVSYRQNEIWDLVWYGYDTIFTLLNVIFIFILTLNYQSKGKLGVFIRIIGENTLGIYFIHVMVGDLFKNFFSSYEISSLVVINMIFAFFILITSLLITFFLKKIPILRFLVSL